MKICYFTATGNCLYVAKRIGGELLSIPQLMRQEKIEITDDAVGVVCPADNITVTDRVTFSDHCEVCYACLHNCPRNAIHMKVEKSAVRFRNEHVSLQDIIQANE